MSKEEVIKYFFRRYLTYLGAGIVYFTALYFHWIY